MHNGGTIDKEFN